MHREAGREVAGDGPQVDRRGSPVRGSAGRGKNGERGSGIVRIRVAADQTGAGQLVDEPTHSRAAKHNALAQLAHTQPLVRRGGQLEENVVPGQRQSGLVADRPVHYGHEAGVHS
jgi:hypothetical protein